MPGKDPAPLDRSARATSRNSANISPRATASFADARPAEDRLVCTGPLTLCRPRASSKRDIDNFKAALEGVDVDEAFLPANTPGTIEHWLRNEHYKTEEDYLDAIADVHARGIQGDRRCRVPACRSTIPICPMAG